MITNQKLICEFSILFICLISFKFHYSLLLDAEATWKKIIHLNLPVLIKLKTQGTFWGPTSLSAQQSNWPFRWFEARKASCSKKIEDTFIKLWATVVCWISLRKFKSEFVDAGVFGDKDSIQWNFKLDDGTLSTVHCTGIPFNGFTTGFRLFFKFWWLGCEFDEKIFSFINWAWLCAWWWTSGEFDLYLLSGSFDE